MNARASAVSQQMSFSENACRIAKAQELCPPPVSQLSISTRILFPSSFLFFHSVSSEGEPDADGYTAG